MIDEELYQQAADELNSDARRPHLWARACALSSDDHDEARYLYTNLRVEELIAERKANSDGAPVPAALDQDTGFELSLTPVDGEDGDDPVSSLRSGMDSPEDRSQFGAFEEPPDNGDAQVSTVRTETRMDVDEATDFGFELEQTSLTEDPDSAAARASLGRDDPHDSTLDQTLDDSLDRALNETAEESLHAGASTPPLSDERGRDDVDGMPLHDDEQAPLDSTLIDEPHWLDDDTVFEPTTPPPATPRDEPLARSAQGSAGDLADDLSGDLAGKVALAPADERLDEPRESVPASSEVIRNPMADARDLNELLAARPVTPAHDDEQEPLVDLDGSGPVWALYENDAGQINSVRRGVSWGAMLFTLPWLLWRGLIGTALVYALLWIVSLGGLLLTALAWSEAGAAAPPVLRAVCAGFATIVLLGLIVVPWLRANRWRETAWQRRGDVMRGEVRARSAQAALQRVLTQESGDRVTTRSTGTVAA